MSRIDIQEIRFFKQQLKSSNEEMRTVIEKVQQHALAYADDTSMSGQAVKASQAYFQAAYTTVTESLLEVLDVSEERLTKYLNDFSNQVDPSPSCRIDSDLLQMAADKVGQIRRKQEDLQRSLSSATAGLYEGKAQQLRMDLAEAVEQEKILERYREFEHGHNGFFQELCALVAKTRRTLQDILNHVTFNEQQGSYSFPAGYADTISGLQKELNEVRGIDPKKEKELEAYEIYAVVYIGANGKPEVMWILEQNGQAVRNYALTGYLEKTGQYLSPDKYQVISLDDVEDKILEGWKDGGYYLSGKKYSGVEGATLKASAYVQSGAEWAQESSLADVVMGLGLSTAAIRGSTTFKKGSGVEVPKLSTLSEAQKLKIANQYKKQAPINIPETSKISAKTMNAGYEQITYRWNDGQYKYEARWHTRTPGAPVDQGNTWVVQRKVPGNGGNPPQSFFKIGDNEWIEGYKWYDAIDARKAGIATPEQIKILDKGHWKE